MIFSLFSQKLLPKRIWLVVIVFTLSEPHIPSVAQLIPDRTLGSQSSTVNTNGAIDTIRGGVKSGANLFHSFLELNVGSGRSLYFSDPGVSNILTRVTGTNPSKIDGRLGVSGTANLFLINPNGIIFGSGSSLDIRGSFTATTAAAIKFADGSEFSATNPQAPSLLTIAVPIGLQRGTNQPAVTIMNRGNLQTGQDLTLEADRLDLQGTLQAGRDLTLLATDTVKVRDTATDPFLAQAGRNLTIQGDRAIDILALNHPTQTPFVSGGNLSLISDGTISGDARFASQGSLDIRSVSGGLANFTSLYDPIITTAGDVNLAVNYTGASLLIEAGGNIRVQGLVNITAPDVAAPFVGDDVALNTQPGLILRSGQATRRYAVNSGAVAGSTTGVGIVPQPGITLQRNVTVANGGVVRLTAAGTGSISTQAIRTRGGAIAFTSAQSITTNGQPLDVGLLPGNAGSIQLTAQNGNIDTGDLFALSVTGAGGAIQLAVPNGNLVTGALLAYSDSGTGGTVAIATRGSATLDSINTSSFSGNGGNLSIIAGGVTTNDIYVYSFINGNSGNASITSGGTISFNNIDAYSENGMSGNVTLTALADVIAIGEIDVSAYGSGRGGQLTVQAGGDIRLTNGAMFRSDTFVDANAGNISVSGRSLFLENGAQIRSVSRYGATGNSGNITVNASNGVKLSGVGIGDTPSAIFTLADLFSTGNGGDITINTGSLMMRDGSEILANHFGEGIGTRAGNITIRAKDTISLEGFRVRTVEGDSPGTGIGSNLVTGITNSTAGINRRGGTIDIQASGLEILNGAFVATVLETGSNGQSGNIRLNIGSNGVPGDILIAGSATRESTIASGTNPGSIGNGGNLEITAGTVSLRDNAFISAEAKSSGNGGSIRLNTTNLSVGNRSAVTVETTAAGNAGAINLVSDRVTVENGGQIRSKTVGQGQAGDVNIQADAVTVTGNLSGIISGSGDPDNRNPLTGDGGNIRLTTRTLQVLDDGILSASTFTNGRGGSIDITAASVELASQGKLSATTQGRGNAGSITVNASDRVTITGDRSGIFANSTPQASGNSGNVFVASDQLLLQDKARITVATQGQGQGGDVQIFANQIDLDSQSLITAETSGIGKGGNLNLNANRLTVQNGAAASVSGQGTGAGGNLTATANSLTLDNQGKLIAETDSSDGGNINLNVRDILLLRRNSLISASAGTAQAGGDGGNITIKAGFVVGVLDENSDIRANAFTGNGGRVKITAQGIFGLQFQSKLTPFSDITASSEFGLIGTVTLNTLNIDPNRGLVQLPNTFTSTNQIAQTCSPQQSGNSFIVTGRGGVSLDPTEALNQTPVWTDGQARQGRGGIEGQENPNLTLNAQPLVEATGLSRNADGSISLVAEGEVAQNNAAIAALNCQPNLLGR